MPGICVDQTGQQLCDFEDVRIECGATTRRKRNAEGQNEFKIKFKLRMQQKSKLDTECKTKCERTANVVLFDDCYNACEEQFEQQRVDAMKNVSTKINTVLNPGESINRHTGSDSQGTRARVYSQTNSQPSQEVCTQIFFRKLVHCISENWYTVLLLNSKFR